MRTEILYGYVCTYTYVNICNASHMTLIPLFLSFIYLNFYFLAVPCSTWDFSFPNQGSNLYPLHWKHGVLTTGSPGKPLSFFILKHYFLLFIYFCLCWVFIAANRLSPAAVGRGFSLWWFFLLWSMGSRTQRLSRYGPWA